MCIKHTLSVSDDDDKTVHILINNNRKILTLKCFCVGFFPIVYFAFREFKLSEGVLKARGSCRPGVCLCFDMSGFPAAVCE